MSETPDTTHAYGWTVTNGGASGYHRPTLALPNHTCALAVWFETADEAWWFIDNVILPVTSGKVALGYVEASE